MESNIVEIDPNVPVDCEELLPKENNFLFVGWFYRANRLQFTCFCIVCTIVLWSCFGFVVYKLDAMGINQLLLKVLVFSMAFFFASLCTCMWSAFNHRGKPRRNLGTSRNRQQRRLMIDEEDEQLRRLLEEQKKNIAVREDSSSTQEGGKLLVIPVVSEEGDSNVRGQSTNIQVHNTPVYSQEPSNSTETSKESAESSLEKLKYAEKSDSQSGAGEDRQYSLVESDVVKDTLPATDNNDESVNTVSSDSPHEKEIPKTST